MFTLIMMMNAMGDELPQVHNQIMDTIVHSSADNSYTPMQAQACLDMEQQLTNSKSLGSRNLVLATTTKQLFSHMNRTCSVCRKSGHLKCCVNPKCSPRRQIGHTWAECFSEGGGRAGQHEAVLKEKAEKACMGISNAPRLSAIATGKSGTIHFNTKGCAYFMELDTQTIFPLHNKTTNVSSTASQEFAGLASDILSPEIANLFAVNDVYKYNALFLDISTLHASINWHLHSNPVDITAITYKAFNQCAPTTINPAIIPFFLDTGASVHISNCQLDFFHLHPVAPCAVHGVGGSTIQAIGVRSICLIIAKGIHPMLENVLFIPNTTIQLISISTLTTSHKCVVHFTNSSCWVTSVNRTHILSGTLTAHHLYAISGGQLTATHTFTITCRPTLETWHCHLRHMNYRTVMECTHHNSMHVPSSPHPSLYNHCILGKQTQSIVPNVREGVQVDRKLGIVHVDLMEHPEHVSASGNHYMMNIIDNFSSYCWSVPLSAKSEAFLALKAWELACEAETGLHVGILHIFQQWQTQMQ